MAGPVVHVNFRHPGEAQIHQEHAQPVEKARLRPWDNRPVTFPQRFKGQSHWLCIRSFMGYRTDLNGNKQWFEQGTPYVERGSVMPFYPGFVYSATEKQLPHMNRPVVRMVVGEDGIERIKYIRDPMNPDPRANLVPDYEIDYDEVGVASIRTEDIGVDPRFFVLLPDNRREAEAVVRHWRANHSVPSTPLIEDREDDGQNDHYADSIDDVPAQKVVHSGPYTGFGSGRSLARRGNDHEPYETSEVETPEVEPSRLDKLEKVVTDLASAVTSITALIQQQQRPPSVSEGLVQDGHLPPGVQPEQVDSELDKAHETLQDDQGPLPPAVPPPDHISILVSHLKPQEGSHVFMADLWRAWCSFYGEKPEAKLVGGRTRQKLLEDLRQEHSLPKKLSGTGRRRFLNGWKLEIEAMEASLKPSVAA